jgi:hypothetical protein
MSKSSITATTQIIDPSLFEFFISLMRFLVANKKIANMRRIAFDFTRFDSQQPVSIAVQNFPVFFFLE